MAFPKLIDLLIQLDDDDILSLKQFIQTSIDEQSSLMKTFLYILNKRRNIELIKNENPKLFELINIIMVDHNVLTNSQVNI